MPELFKINIFELEAIYRNEYTEGEIAADAFMNAIQVAQRLDDLNNRVKRVHGTPRRLENPVRTDGNALLLHFTTGHYSGPGHANQHTPVASFQMDPDDFFAHDTAMLFDCRNYLAFVESRRPGMSGGAIAYYFSRFANRGWRFYLTPRLDPTARRKALKKSLINNLHIRWIVGPTSREEVEEYGNEISILNELGERFGCSMIDTTLKVHHGSGQRLNITHARRFLNRALRAAANDRVTSLRLSGRDDGDLRAEILDLLQHREQRERQLEVDPISRKIDLEVRWQNLMEIWQQYLDDAGLD